MTEPIRPGAASPPHWQHLRTEVAGEFRLLRVLREQARSPRTGEPHTFEVVESADGVVAVALTPERGLVLVEQYRIPLRRNVLELPGGILEPHEDPVAAAERELREETGFVATSARPLGVLTVNPSFLTTRIHVVLCQGAEPRGTPDLDAGEDPRLRIIPFDDLDEVIASGEIDNAVAIAGLGLLRIRGG